jgi:hypothetical protein
MLLWLETLDISIKDTDTVNIAFLRVLAEKLLTNANAEDGLLQVANDFVKSAHLQVFHSLRGMSLTGKQYAVSLLQLLSIIRQ